MKRFWFIAALLVCSAGVVTAQTNTSGKVIYSQTSDGASASGTHDAEVKEKPNPQYELKGGTVNWDGEIIVSMILRSNRKVSDIKIIKGGTPEINKAVIKAVRKIEFVPAMKDGHPVSQYATIIYTFKSEANNK